MTPTLNTLLHRFTDLRANCLPFSILVFILTLLLLSADFYYLKNIAGRRLVGLRWWNEVNTSSGDSHWVFESSDPNVRTVTATDKRFFWLSLYVTPALWIALAILAIVRFVSPVWLSLVGKLIYLSCSRYDMRMEHDTNISQQLLLFSQSQIPWLSHDVTSSAKHPCLLAVLWGVVS